MSSRAMTAAELRAAIEFARNAARSVFAKRERPGRKNVEVHLSEHDLRVIIEAVFQAAYELGLDKAGR